jgi:glycosyltransferase involved in cell wall biosynthesis
MGEGRVGEKSFLEELQRLVGGLPPGVEVEWLGQVGAVRDVLKRCHVFASLSRAEQAPLLLVEAMALGVPVVVTDVGDQAAMVDYGRLGEVVSGDGKAEEVAGALQRIMDPLRESAGLREEAARAWALGNHDPGVLGQEAAKVVHLLCSRPYHPSQPTMEG